MCFFISLIFLFLSRKRAEDKMRGGNGRKPDSFTSGHHWHEQRRSPVSSEELHTHSFITLSSVKCKTIHCLKGVFFFAHFGPQSHYLFGFVCFIWSILTGCSEISFRIITLEDYTGLMLFVRCCLRAAAPNLFPLVVLWQLTDCMYCVNEWFFFIIVLCT